MSLLHFQTVTQLPLGHGPTIGSLCAWSEDNVVATCSQRVIMMHHVRRLTDGQMIACVESVEEGIQFTERNDNLVNSSASGMALLTYISKKYDPHISLSLEFFLVLVRAPRVLLTELVLAIGTLLFVPSILSITQARGNERSSGMLNHVFNPLAAPQSICPSHAARVQPNAGVTVSYQAAIQSERYSRSATAMKHAVTPRVLQEANRIAEVVHGRC